MSIRIYLDHKDYGNITKGLRGDFQHRKDAELYETLLKRVRNGSVTCYFSAIHIVEAIRSTHDDWLKRYSDVVDNLTEGHCVVFRLQLEERELAVFLSSQFGIPTDLEAPHLAFGRGADAFIDVEAEIDSLIDKLTETVTTEFRQANRHARRALLSRGLPLPPRSSITNIPSAVLDVFYEPGVADQLIGPAPMIAKKRIAQRVLDRIGRFESILPFYKLTQPEFGQVGYVFDASEILTAIGLHREFHPMMTQHGQTLDFKAIRARLVAKIAHHLSEKAPVVIGVRQAEVESALVKADLRGMPSWNAAVSIWIEYLRQNTGKSNRDLEDSDLRDILHLSHGPYMDYLLTDRYFVGLAAALRQDFPNTVVLRTLEQLCSELDKVLGPIGE